MVIALHSHKILENSGHQLTALVAGASGLIGKQLLNLLLESNNYTKVKAIVRKPLGITHPKLHEITIDFEKLWEKSILLKADHVFCTLGTTIKKAGSQQAFKKVDYEYPLTLARMAKENGTSRILIVTALGADAKSQIFYNRVKGELENELKKLDLPHLYIFRPSLLLGDRHEYRFGERMAIVLSKFLAPLFSLGKLSAYKPIEAKTVAKAMMLLASNGVEKETVMESYTMNLLCGD